MPGLCFYKPASRLGTVTLRSSDRQIPRCRETNPPCPLPGPLAPSTPIAVSPSCFWGFRKTKKVRGTSLEWGWGLRWPRGQCSRALPSQPTPLTWLASHQQVQGEAGGGGAGSMDPARLRWKEVGGLLRPLQIHLPRADPGEERLHFLSLPEKPACLPGGWPPATPLVLPKTVPGGLLPSQHPRSRAPPVPSTAPLPPGI